MVVGVFFYGIAPGLVVKHYELVLLLQNIVYCTPEKVAFLVSPLHALAVVSPSFQHLLVIEKPDFAVQFLKLWRQQPFFHEIVKVGFQDSIHTRRQRRENGGWSVNFLVEPKPEE